MKFSRRRDYGFTLMELLVVIAIIGILAVMLFPAIKRGITIATATRMGSNGKQLISMIVAENLEREVVGRAPIWPDKGITATDFFEGVMDSGTLTGVDYTFFAGGGIPTPPEGATFGDKYNCWSMLSGVNDKHPDSLPFLLTKNVTGLDDADFKGQDQADTPVQLSDIDPFGQEYALTVTKGMAIIRSKPKYFTKYYLFGGLSPTNAANYDVQYMVTPEG